MFVKIDFRNKYDFNFASNDYRVRSFQAELKDGSPMDLYVKIDKQPHELLPNVYNMAFGPLNRKGQVDGQIQLAYQNYSRVFSTILWSANLYLSRNRDHFIGIDGSDNRRAHMYYKLLQRNYDYFHKHFRIYGIKYYVRITRFGKHQYDDPFDFEDVQYIRSPIEKNDETPYPMFNYFVFNLKYN